MKLYSNPSIENPIDFLEEIYKNEGIEIRKYNSNGGITTDICRELWIPNTFNINIIAQALWLKHELKRIRMFPYKTTPFDTRAQYYCIIAYSLWDFMWWTYFISNLKDYSDDIYICIP